LLLCRGSDDDGLSTKNRSTCATEFLKKLHARHDGARCVGNYRGCQRRCIVGRYLHLVAVGKVYAGMPFHDGDGAGKAARRQEVIGTYDRKVLGFCPVNG
jgi:hypothetical protein